MFSSNQVFDVVCEPEDLKAVLKLAFAMHESKNTSGYYASCNPFPGAMAIGHLRNMSNTDIDPKRWYTFSSSTKPGVIADRIKMWHALQDDPPRPDTDGGIYGALRVQSLYSAKASGTLPEGFEPSVDFRVNCIVVVTPCWAVYEK